MKKFLYLLLVLPLVTLLAACSDDDNSKDLPEVSMNLQYSGAVMDNHQLYAVKGDTITIQNVSVTPLPGTKKATLGEVTYAFDGLPFFRSIVTPYTAQIVTNNLPVGKYSFTVVATVFQVDKEIAFATFTYPVNIVATASELPGDVPETTNLNEVPFSLSLTK